MLLRRGIISSGILSAVPPATFSTAPGVFNGSSKYANTASIAAFDDDLLSAGAFFKLGSLGSIQTIISKSDRNNNSTQSWTLTVTAADVLEVFIRQSTPTSIAVVGTTTLSTGVWYTAFFTMNGSTVELYLDAVSEGSGSIAGVLATSTDLLVGAQLQASSAIRLLDGEIGFAGVWDAGLSGSAVSDFDNSGEALCRGQLPSSLTADLVSYWHLADFTGHTTDELTDQEESSNLTGNGSLAFTGSGLDVTC